MPAIRMKKIFWLSTHTEKKELVINSINVSLFEVVTQTKTLPLGGAFIYSTKICLFSFRVCLVFSSYIMKA